MLQQTTPRQPGPALGPIKERFATPLSVGTADTTYWSKHDRDAVFGALHNAYSCQWSGTSLAFPGMDISEADKAVRWALWSAMHGHHPTATLLALPRSHLKRGTPGYLRWIRENPTICQHIITIPHKRGTPPPLWREDVWLQKASLPDSPGNKDLELILISNSQAQAHLRCKDRGNASTMLNDLRHAHLEDNEDMTLSDRLKRKHKNARINKAAWDWLATPVITGPQIPPTPAETTAPPPKTYASADEEILPTWQATPQPSHQQLRDAHTPSPLKHDWRGMAYTDGSRIDEGRSDEGPDGPAAPSPGKPLPQTLPPAWPRSGGH